MRWLSFQNSSAVATSLSKVKSKIQQTPPDGPELTCEGAKGTMRKLAFHTKHEKMGVVRGCLTLSIYLLKFPEFIILGHFATFC